MVNKHILLIGAGRSVQSLVDYIAEHLLTNGCTLTVAERDLERAKKMVGDLPNTTITYLDVTEREKLSVLIDKANLVISMLPAFMHLPIAEVCVRLGKFLLTASYVSPEINALHNESLQKDILIMMECGLDPGIDHMSAMQEINEIKDKGGDITLFKSYTGGLIAPESDDNPWGYKITWNPRNVVLAGKGGVKFIRNGQYKHIPYHNLFNRTEVVSIDDHGDFEGYPNRDSLSYRDVYGLENIPTILRGTLRKKGFTEAWHILVQLGYTDDTILFDDLKNLTIRDITNSFLPFSETLSLEQKLQQKHKLSDEVMEKLTWLGLFDRTTIPLESATACDILLHIISSKWKLSPQDKDMIVMQHQFDYTLSEKNYTNYSSLVLKGTDAEHTSMSATVGLPLGIMAKLILENKITKRGVCRPIYPEMYTPILAELENYGVHFKRKTIEN